MENYRINDKKRIRPPDQQRLGHLAFDWTGTMKLGGLYEEILAAWNKILYLRRLEVSYLEIVQEEECQDEEFEDDVQVEEMRDDVDTDDGDINIEEMEDID